MKFKKANNYQVAPNGGTKPENFDKWEEDYQETVKWYEDGLQEPKKFDPVTEQILIELKEEAKKCHDSEVANYNIKNSRTNSNFQWMKTVMNKGTVADKIAAHTVSIQDNPICNLETLRNMVNMVKVGKKKECFTVMETLTELFISSLLKPDQKLTPFHSKPLSALNEMSSGNAITRRKILSRWHFEDELKEIFTSFVLALGKAAQDTVESNKEKAITAMFKLLAGNPEQEKNLLASIINKLGDPSQKVASKAIYCLTQLLFKHPNMQSVVLKEVEKLLFRANISSKAQYYCLCFLSQFYLSPENPDVAKKMIDVYLAFFKACVKKGEVDSRMMSALLMGINRAYPYSKLEFDDLSGHVDTLYKLTHLASFNIALQVLTLLYHVTGEKMADRFFSALYKKLMDPKLLTTTHQAMLLSLLYKSLMKDTQVERIKMFVKRLLQICLFVQPSFSCGILYLITQLFSKRTNLQALTLKELELPDLDRFGDDEEKYYDIKDEKDDSILQLEEKPGPATVSESIADNNEENDCTDDIEIKEEDEKPDINALDVSFKGNGWVHVVPSDKKAFKAIIKYNPMARNPLFGGGEFLAYTEFRYLENHFHPTVALWAGKIMKGEKVNYPGDPLKDFTTIRFLDRFAFKNPKSLEDKTGAHPTFGKRKMYKPKGVKTLRVNTKGYLNEDEKNIPVDELFLYSYLQQRYQDRSTFKDEDDSDLESVQSDEFEEMLERMPQFKDAVGDADLDFMGEIGDNLKKQKKATKRKSTQDSDEEDDQLSDEEDGLSDEDDGLDDEEDLMDGDDFEGEDEDLDELEPTEEDFALLDGLSDGEEDMEFGGSDSEDEMKPKRSSKKGLKKKHSKNDVGSLLASADEFAALLDDEGSSVHKPGSSNVMDNKDKASQKQLKWEESRNRWLKGFNKATGKEGRSFSKKRPSKTMPGNSSKKPKRK
ncbi:CCAAT/enhancer-binding protein zeta [Dendroctonus ponderosae]|nr:CCAAT/enhancer-binding protein zeta [Dendroctonus ponderosae]